MVIPSKTKARTTTWVSNSTSGYTSEKTKTLYLKKKKQKKSDSKSYMHPDVPNSIIYNSQDTKAT